MNQQQLLEKIRRDDEILRKKFHADIIKNFGLIDPGSPDFVYYTGGFEEKMTVDEAMLILGIGPEYGFILCRFL